MARVVEENEGFSVARVVVGLHLPPRFCEKLLELGKVDIRVDVGVLGGESKHCGGRLDNLLVRLDRHQVRESGKARIISGKGVVVVASEDPNLLVGHDYRVLQL